MSQMDVTPEDALEIAQRAMQKANEVDDLRQQVDELEADIVEVRARLSAMDGDKEYQHLTLDDKIGKVREHGFKKARKKNGMATLDYSDVMWEVFNGEPSPAHCYKLIRKAAGLDEAETGSNEPGYTAEDPEGASYRLSVNAKRVKVNYGFYSENKTDQAGAD